ncbi:MAG TPA: hypothetical protein VHP32_01460 [Ignavibacteria bacterium]|nr:hypothetical protein [Ignavibacteria bacterium]
MFSIEHKYNLINSRKDFSIYKCEECQSFFVVLNNVILTLALEEITELNNTLKSLWEENRKLPDSKFLVQVSNFEKARIFLSHSEMKTLLILLKESLILLEVKKLISN